jgi:hypothetical protein
MSWWTVSFGSLNSPFHEASFPLQQLVVAESSPYQAAGSCAPAELLPAAIHSYQGVVCLLETTKWNVKLVLKNI